MTKAEKIRALELENARLRGANEALEKIVAAYRAERTAAPPPPVWPLAPFALPSQAPPVFSRDLVGGHGGLCACPQCLTPWGVTVECGAYPTYPDLDLVMGGPQRPGGTYGASQ